jgi:hypothetical protein
MSRPAWRMDRGRRLAFCEALRRDGKIVIAKYPFTLPAPPGTPSTAHSSMADRSPTGRRRSQRFGRRYLTPIECMSKGNF